MNKIKIRLATILKILKNASIFIRCAFSTIMTIDSAESLSLICNSSVSNCKATQYLFLYLNYQLKQMTIVLIVNVFVEKSCQMRPVEVSASDCSLSNISSVSFTPFPFANLTNIFLASARLPLLRSHLGDSGIVLKSNDIMTEQYMREVIWQISQGKHLV